MCYRSYIGSPGPLKIQAYGPLDQLCKQCLAIASNGELSCLVSNCVSQRISISSFKSKMNYTTLYWWYCEDFLFLFKLVCWLQFDCLSSLDTLYHLSHEWSCVVSQTPKRHVPKEIGLTTPYLVIPGSILNIIGGQWYDYLLEGK